MQQQLAMRSGHLMVPGAGGWWILDTGAPASFGTARQLRLADRTFPVMEGYAGLNADVLSGLVGEPVAGLIGMDILGGLDIVIDVPKGELIMSSQSVELAGDEVHLTEFLGIPVLQVGIAGQSESMFFDTGASISYFQGEAILQYPPVGRVQDFFPGAGRFEVDTYRVGLSIGGRELEVNCGQLPGLLGMSLSLAQVTGIVGNEVCSQGAIGFFPRRHLLVLA
jgi:hypothetical protein